MVILTRRVRFAVNPDGGAEAAGPNGYAGVPCLRGLGRHYEVEVACAGPIDPRTGYLVNIKRIDQAVRQRAIPVVAAACRERPITPPASLLPELLGSVDAALEGRVRRVRWWLSPYHSVEMAKEAPSIALIRQKFDFSASHRLHNPALSDEENRALYGKCNHPGGHGHNYQVEPCVAVPLESVATFTLADLERLTDAAIVQRYDHKHLNQDVPEFGPGGVNPSVENIARLCHERLGEALGREFPQVALRCVTVWETDRTCATYPG